MILKLMIVEIKRYLRSLYYLVVLFILFLIHMLGLKGGVPFLFWGDDFLENVNFICIVLSLLMSVYICDEFSYGTVQNKLYLGYKKSQIYIAEAKYLKEEPYELHCNNNQYYKTIQGYNCIE